VVVITFKDYLREAVSTTKKDPGIVKDNELVGLIGKTAFNSMKKHPWLQTWASFDRIWRHGVNNGGFHEVEFFPYHLPSHTTPEGKLRPELMIRFIISHYGGRGKVIQAEKYRRDKVPGDMEKRHGPGAGWVHVTSWKQTDKDGGVK
jgi:hypothetical protein